MDSIADFIVGRLLIIPGILIGLSFHEFGHAFVSDRLGDPTPRMQGRVSLSPAAHIDPLGLLMLFIIGFGWGRPVQIDPQYYKHRRRDELLVSLAGVIMNLLLAICFMGVLRLFYQFAGEFVASDVGAIVWQILIGVIQINLVLMFFNLIPLPPLDGFGIITQIFKLDRKSWYYSFYRMGPILLMVIIIFNITSWIIIPGVTFMYNLLSAIFF
ncbi:MAG: site-2 protease family protein [Anaerovoracaceae bacterium]